MTTFQKEMFELYKERPQDPLYHYTSLGGLKGIVDSGSLYATDIRFFNDAAEMQHTANLLKHEIAVRVEQNTSNTKRIRLLHQLKDWVSHRLTNGHMLFIVSFTANGNILSQWRGYCPTGKGVSIGFDPHNIWASAEQQSFRFGRCRYDLKEQQALVSGIINSIEELADQHGEDLDISKRHPANSFHDIFESVEGNLLNIAALLKHPAFQEEKEWRAVSPIFTNYVEAPISYRESVSMLTPYINFMLPKTTNETLAVEHAFLGPTPNVNNSMASLSQYLSKYGANPKKGLMYCGIPYRA